MERRKKTVDVWGSENWLRTEFLGFPLAPYIFVLGLEQQKPRNAKGLSKPRESWLLTRDQERDSLSDRTCLENIAAPPHTEHPRWGGESSLWPLTSLVGTTLCWVGSDRPGEELGSHLCCAVTKHPPLSRWNGLRRNLAKVQEFYHHQWWWSLERHSNKVL